MEYITNAGGTQATGRTHTNAFSIQMQIILVVNMLGHIPQ